MKQSDPDICVTYVYTTIYLYTFKRNCDLWGLFNNLLLGNRGRGGGHGKKFFNLGGWCLIGAKMLDCES